MHVCVCGGCVCVWLRQCVRACVCGYERERGREGGREREREREGGRETDILVECKVLSTGAGCKKET